MNMLVDFVQHRASPQTLRLAATTSLLCVVADHLLQSNFIVVPVTSVQQFPPPVLPDMCWRGFTLLEFSAWYTSIGQQGRFAYLLLMVLDAGVMIPSYVVILETVMAWTECPTPFYYLPLLAAAFDLVAKSIFLAANVMFPKLFVKVGVIHAASRVTQMKFVMFLLSFVGILFQYIRRRNKHAPSQKLSQKKD
jgi:hypothetical protein